MCIFRTPLSCRPKKQLTETTQYRSTSYANMATMVMWPSNGLPLATMMEPMISHHWKALYVFWIYLPFLKVILIYSCSDTVVDFSCKEAWFIVCALELSPFFWRKLQYIYVLSCSQISHLKRCAPKTSVSIVEKLYWISYVLAVFVTFQNNTKWMKFEK